MATCHLLNDVLKFVFVRRRGMYKEISPSFQCFKLYKLQLKVKSTFKTYMCLIISFKIYIYSAKEFNASSSPNWYKWYMV